MIEEEKITVEEGVGSRGEVIEKITDQVREIDVLAPERKWRLVWGSKEIERLKEENEGREGTVYSINLLPLGGFCRIKGEEGGVSSDADSYAVKNFWQKSVVMAGGVIMNILLAAVLLVIGFMIGLPQMTANLTDVSQVKDIKLEIMGVLPGKPAAMAGLQAGDAIIELDEVVYPRLKQMQDYVDEHKKDLISVSVQRGDQVITKTIRPVVYEDTGKGGLGVSIIETGVVSYPWYKAIYHGVATTGLYLKEIVVAFFYFFKGLFTGAGVADAVAGPVGIAVMTGKVARLGLLYLIQFTAVLSLNLAIINILPLPALDGGRLFFLFINKLRRRPISQKIEQNIHLIGFNLLILLVIIVTIKDVGAFRGVFMNLLNKVF